MSINHLAPQRTGSHLNKGGVGTPGLTLVISFKRLTSRGTGRSSDPLGSMTATEKLWTLGWVSVGKEVGERRFWLQWQEELELGLTQHCRAGWYPGRMLHR